MKFMNRTALAAVATLLAYPLRVLAAPEKPANPLVAPTLGDLAAAGDVVIPRALATANIRADGSDPKALIAQINAAVKEMREVNDSRLDKLEAKVDPLDVQQFEKISETVTDMETALNAINAKIAAAALNGAQRAQPVDAAYTEKFVAWARDGSTENELKAMHRPGQTFCAL